MKVICPISGLEEYHGEFFKGERAISVPHPIFFLSDKQLFARARKYKQDLYSETERKLLFLALLHKTDLVEWEVPADPSPACVLRNLDQAFKLLIWFIEVNSGGWKLPKYRVTEHNRDLGNIGEFFSQIYEARQEWDAPNRRRLLDNLLERREMLLWRKMNSSKKTPSYYKQLASWALDASEAPKHAKEIWQGMLECYEPHDFFDKVKPASSGDQAKDIAGDPDFEEMHSWLHSELTREGSVGMGSGYTYTQEVLKHINYQWNLYQLGPKGYMLQSLGGGQAPYTIKTERKETTEIVDEIAQLEKQIVEEQIPLVEPKRSDFPAAKLGDWIRARAKWISTQTVRDKLLLARKTLELRNAVSQSTLAE